MLILKRQKGEAVVIGDNIFCKVISISGDHVCLGFDAPQTLTINCEEVHEQNLMERQGMASVDDNIRLDEAQVEALIAQYKSRALKASQGAPFPTPLE